MRLVKGMVDTHLDCVDDLINAKDSVYCLENKSEEHLRLVEIDSVAVQSRNYSREGHIKLLEDL
jgi:hypothetical protein